MAAAVPATSSTFNPSAPATDEVKREWFWLNGDQRKPFSASSWQPYDPHQQLHLSASYAAMLIEGRREGCVLDLAAFSDPPSPYKVYKGQPVEVVNKEEALVGGLAIAGFPKDLWDVPLHQLPPSAKHGKVVTGFYQIRKDSVDLLEEYTRYLSTPSGMSNPCANELCRRRVVLLIEHERPKFMFGDVDRFRKKRTPAVATAPPAGEDDSVPPGDAVFQWWWGDPMSGWGHWKNYHPHVSEHLEKSLATNEGFRTCTASVAIDEVRYRIQRICRERPYDYLKENLAGNFREQFMPDHVVTVDCPLYDDVCRLTSNCFVQFQSGNPKRRRPVRRIRRGDAAGIEMPEGEPCGICFSDTGVLTGCDKAHVVCHSCLRMGLRVIVGDIGHREGLVCGCLTYRDNVALQGLAEKADITTQDLIANPPEEKTALSEYLTELAQVRRAFQLPVDEIPKDAYSKKIQEWYEMIRFKESEHLYHACQHPGCGMDNWILKTDFDEEYKSQGLYTWTCKAGHKNSVLPSQDEINEINKNILMHPEYYDDSCGYDQMALRRFRLCPQCVGEGMLTFAVHESGCKQWPGGGASASGHRHCFCFHCTAVWGTACTHSNRCTDPGIQQVRRITTSGGDVALQIGFIEAQAYIDWLKGTKRICPPTIFPNSEMVLGATRHGMLGMEDRSALHRCMMEGTR